MKKLLSGILLMTITLAALCAGDVATFVDKGFSEDGKYYIFGQYGRTDKKYQGWAEIYQVDISKNDYVDGGVFRTKPSAVTSDKNGIQVYEALEAKSYYYFKNIKTKKADADHVLYVCDDVNKTGSDKIVFKDFRAEDVENADSYSIQLVSTVINSGKNVKSSFYILVEKKDKDGKVIASKKVGSPDIVRKGICDYKIERIMCDESEQKFIFIVEKILEDETGISIRYMVEAAEID